MKHILCVVGIAGVLGAQAKFVDAQIERTPVSQVATPVFEGKAASLLPSGKNWKLVWHDEFDGKEIDRTKWMCRESFWGYDMPALSHDWEGVEMTGETVKLHLVRKGDDFTSPQLQTGSLTFDVPRDSSGFWPFGKRKRPLFMKKYGYFEIRCRQPKCPGWHSAFWFQSPSIGAHPDPAYAGIETDIMENYQQHTKGKIVGGNGWSGYGKDSCWFDHFEWTHEETADGWHNYGCDWSPEGYVFYCDGKKVGEQNFPVSHVPEFVLVTTEAAGYRKVAPDGGLTAGRKTKEWGKPDPRLFDVKLPDCFEVDYVRVYDNADGYAPAPGPLPLVRLENPPTKDDYAVRVDALRTKERRLHVAPEAAKRTEFPEAELLRMNAEADALLAFARNEKEEAVLKSVMVSCAKALRDRRKAGAAPVKIVFDTDMIADYDDVGAMAVLHKLADQGNVKSSRARVRHIRTPRRGRSSCSTPTMGVRTSPSAPSRRTAWAVDRRCIAPMPSTSVCSRSIRSSGATAIRTMHPMRRTSTARRSRRSQMVPSRSAWSDT